MSIALVAFISLLQQATPLTLAVEGAERTAIVYVPNQVTSPAPVVFVDAVLVDEREPNVNTANAACSLFARRNPDGDAGRRSLHLAERVSGGNAYKNDEESRFPLHTAQFIRTRSPHHPNFLPFASFFSLFLG